MLSQRLRGLVVLSFLVLASCDTSQIQLPPAPEPPPQGDTTPPTIIDVEPDAGSTGIQTSTTVRAAFSERIDPSSVGSSSFVLHGSGAVDGALTVLDSILIFTPTSPFEGGVTYTAEITAIRDLSGNTLQGTYAWSFTTGAARDTIPPEVSAVSPENGETGVVASTTVQATFSELMDPASIDGTSFRLSSTGGDVVGTASLTSSVATFTPSTPLEPNTTYTARITTAAQDLAGNHLASDFVWTFTTAPPPDETGPIVISVVPLSSETDVDPGTTIRATFSEPVAAVSVNTGTFLVSGTSPVAGTVTLVDFTAIFTPTSPLAPNTTYTARITTGVEDLAGNSLASDFVWSFTTEPASDQTPPTVISVLPVNGATNVDHDTAVQATFSEPVTPSSVNETTFRLGNGTGSVSGTVSLSGQVATLTPLAPLEANTTYTARVTTGVEDLAGNSMASEYAWSFTTAPPPDLTPPTVASTDPLAGATNVDVGAAVRATFSESLLPASVSTSTFTLTGGAGAVSGTVSLSGGTTATFTPAGPLQAITMYTARLATGIEDLAGNHLASDYTWTFTTTPPPDETPPTVESVTPFSGATDVDPGIDVTATFSESIDPASVNGTTFLLSSGSGSVSGTVMLSGETATFSPTGNLDHSALYTARVTTGVQDLAGNNMASDFVWTFTTAAPPDTTPPTVAGRVPAPDTTDVSLEAAVTVTFSEPIDPTSVTPSTFVLSGSQVEAGTLSVNGSTVTFTPDSPLDAVTLYTVTLTTGIQDLAGNPLETEVVWSFTTTHLPPVANAGPNQTVMVLSTVTLDGTGSYDPEGQPLTHEWTQVHGTDVTGGTGKLYGPNPTFTAPALPTRIDFDLRVNDGTYTSTPDRVRITVELLAGSRAP